MLHPALIRLGVLFVARQQRLYSSDEVIERALPDQAGMGRQMIWAGTFNDVWQALPQ